MEFGSLPPRPRRSPGGRSGGQPPDVDELAATLGCPGRAKTTKLYDRTADTVTVDEIERIVI